MNALYRRIERSAALCLVAGALACESSVAPIMVSKLELAVPSAVPAWSSVQLTATAVDSAGHAVPTPALNWSVWDTTVATVDQTGMIHTRAGGTTTVTASTGTLDATARIVVQPAAAATLRVADTIRASLFSAISIQYDARDAGGHPVSGSLRLHGFGPLVDTTSSSGPVALMVGVGTGEVSLDSATATTTIVISPPLTLGAFPDTVGLLVAMPPTQLSIRTPCPQGGMCGFWDAYDAVPAHMASWSSSDPNIATVDSVGRVTAVGAGHATVTATIASTGATATIQVFTYQYSPALEFQQLASDGRAVCGRTTDARIVCTSDTEQIAGSPYGTFMYFAPNPPGFGTTAPTNRCIVEVVAYTGHVTYDYARCSLIPLPVDGDHQFTALAMNGGACGLDTSGKTWCWGLQPVLQNQVPAFTTLGEGTRAAPYCGLDGTGAAVCFTVGGAATAVPGGHHFARLSSGAPVSGWAACAADAAGAAWCWHDSTSTSLSNPVEIQGTNALERIAIGAVACGLDATGFAVCWAPDSSSAVPAPTTAPLQSIAVAEQLACGVTSSGTIACWNALTNNVVFAGPAGEDWTRVFSGGGARLCATARSGKAICWTVGSSSTEVEIPRGG